MNNPQHHHQGHSIKLLPEFLIDQIKAGEIIERPANLLKEVIENALDAQATRIEIHIIGNGLKQITLRDDGVGISFPDLAYAFCRHATSKIEKFQDLYHLHSFGFRGEALASIAAIAQVTCYSRCGDAEGGQITLAGGRAQEPIAQKDLPRGTLLVIKDLFFNTPVRLNFIKSQTAERNSLLRILHSFFISHPKIEFHLKWDREEKSIFRPSERFQRFTQVLSNRRWGKDDFNFIEREYDGHRLTGFYSKMAKKSGQAKNQYLFVNKRPVQDKVIHRIVASVLEGYWAPETSGSYLFELQIPPDQVDVNVHPNKTMVKFATPSIVHSLFHSSLKESFSPRGGARERENKKENGTERERETNPGDLKKSNFESYEQREQGDGHRPTQSIAIGHRYRILAQKQESANFPLVADCATLVQFHLDSISAQFRNENQIPLLVSIPFRGQKMVSKIGNYPHWERDLFEFEQLQDDLVVLKAIPESLTPFPHRAVAFHLLGERAAFERDIAGEGLSIKVLHDLIKKYPLEQLIRAKSITVLNPQCLAKIFQ